MPHPVYTLKQDPATGARTLEGLAERLEIARADVVARFEVGLNEAVAAARRRRLAAGGERRDECRIASERGNAEPVGVLARAPRHVTIGRREWIERRDGDRETIEDDTGPEEATITG